MKDNVTNKKQKTPLRIFLNGVKLVMNSIIHFLIILSKSFLYQNNSLNPGTFSPGGS